ncbi:hypothetical protein ASG49_07515 [Marmoricola sp. Leaf446]|uniref:hypothetical protein n=1 Tax=Marmoricola sp. Leaf446 TaxID=1736379 RepID=UPI0006FBA9B8|nr:hypothetical protein [Marmoricola sp. Leaf446]KQT94671.1 hypothetical protein ASG49_07515 [Marmoricola sp. Leaf446]
MFDQAPVTVVPTGSVVGHVALQRSTRIPAHDDVVEVVQLFVRPGPLRRGFVPAADPSGADGLYVAP